MAKIVAADTRHCHTAVATGGPNPLHTPGYAYNIYLGVKSTLLITPNLQVERLRLGSFAARSPVHLQSAGLDREGPPHSRAFSVLLQVWGLQVPAACGCPLSLQQSPAPVACCRVSFSLTRRCSCAQSLGDSGCSSWRADPSPVHIKGPGVPPSRSSLSPGTGATQCDILAGRFLYIISFHPHDNPLLR